MELVRTAASFAEARGWDVQAILRKAGVSAELLTVSKGRVTEAQAIRIVQALWDLTDDEAFGLGEHPLPRGSFRLLCYGALGAPTLGSALDRVAGFTQAIPAMPQLQTTRDAHLARVSLDIPAARLDQSGVVVCTSLAVAHRVAAWAIAQPLELVGVEFPGRAPIGDEMSMLLFGAPAIVDAPLHGLVFDARWLDAPMTRDAADLERFIAASPAGLLALPKRQPRNSSDRIRKLVQRAIGGPQPGAQEMARALSISEPTLRRQLAAEGTSVREIREAVLRDAAIAALAHGEQPIADLALHLGFSEPSAFTRAFHRWTGSAPSSYRLPGTKS